MSEGYSIFLGVIIFLCVSALVLFLLALIFSKKHEKESKKKIIHMNKKDLYDYIKNRRYLCCFCHDLQQKVIKDGVDVIKNYEGMVCGGVQDMLSRYYDVEKEYKKLRNG